MPRAPFGVCWQVMVFWGLKRCLFICGLFPLLIILIMAQKSLKMVDKYQFNVNKFTTNQGVHEFEAVHVDTKHNYTIRRLALTNDSQGKQYTRMLNELAVLKKLNNPLVPKCHKLFRTSNNMYHIYDRISGETLQAYLRRDLSESNWKNKMKSALFMAEQLCGLLAYLSERRICHSQINLQNILVENEAVTKIVNFSKAKELKNEQEPLELENSSQEHNEYSAPEMNDGKVDIKSDLYSLGVVLQKLFGKLKEGIRRFSHNEKQLATIEKIVSFCRNKMRSSDAKQRINAEQVLAYFKYKQYLDEREPVAEQRSRLLMTDPGVKTSHRQIQSPTQKRSLSPFSSGLKLKKTQVSSEMGSQTQEFLYYSKKVLHKRSLSHLLLRLSDFCTSLAQSSSKCSLPLSFLLIKKSTLIMSQLTKFLDTGRGEGLRMDEKTREKMKKHKKFGTLENIIHTQKKHLQQKFIQTAYSLREVLASTGSEDKLREELQSQTVDKEFFKECLSRFESQVYLWSSVEGEKAEKHIKFSHMLDRKQLIFLFILSLLNEYATIGDMFDELFGQSSCSLQKQSFFVQMMQMEDAQIQALILQQGRINTQKEAAPLAPLGSMRSISASRRNL